MSITRDATSLWYVPANAAEWAELLANTGIPSPSNAWQMQEPSGLLADSIGATSLSFTGNYGVAVTGWSRKAIGFTDSGGAAAITNSGLGNVGTTSALLLALVAITGAPAATRDVMGMGASTSNRCAQVDSSKIYRMRPNDGSSTAIGGVAAGTQVRPLLLQVNRTGNIARVVHDGETITQSPYTAPPNTGALLHFGAAVSSTPPMSILFGAYWQGASSELTLDQLSTLIQVIKTGPLLLATGGAKSSTSIAFSSSSTKSLLRFDETKAEVRPRDALEALAEVRIGPTGLTSSSRARELLTWGKWNHGWMFDDASSGGKAAWGGVHLTQGSSPRYRERGMRIDDYSIGMSNASGYLYSDDAARLDTLVGDDIAFLLAVPDSRVFANASYMIIKSEFVGGNEYFIFGLSDGTIACATRSGATYISASAGAGATAPGIPFVCGFVLERATNKLRTGVCRIGGSPVVSGEVDATGLGTMTNAAGLSLGAGGQVDPVLFGHMMACHGAAAAGGVSANLSTILARYAAAVAYLPSVVDAAAGRGRAFVALSRVGLETTDATPGATLITRDCSVQALVRFDHSEQMAAGEWSIKKANGGAAWDAGASSVETIAGDGYVEFVAPTVTTQLQKIIGLTDIAPTQSFDVKWSLYLCRTGASSLEVSESGNIVSATTFAVGDVLRIERVGTTITYKKNGITFYTSGVTSSQPLRVDSSILTLGADLRSIRRADSTGRRPITWQNVTNVDTALEDPQRSGALYARGKGDSTSEYMGAALELRPVNASANVAELAWLWHTTSGELKRQTGALISTPPSGYLLLTATRRWISSSRVVLRYYVGGTMIGEVESVDGNIGGSTTGTTTIGARQCGGRPRTAAAMAALVGGVWTNGYGWLCDEASGNLIGAFGGVDLAPISSPTYGHPGHRRAFDGVDAAVGFDSTLDAFNGGDILDLAGTDDLMIVWDAFTSAATAANLSVINKYDGTIGWQIFLPNGASSYRFQAVSGGAQLYATADVSAHLGKPHVGMLVIKRSTGKAQMATLADDGTLSVGAEVAASGTTVANALQFHLGDLHSGVGVAPLKTKLGAVYGTAGVGVATSASIVDAIKAYGAAVFGYYGEFFDGVIDELRVCDYELAPEEVEATWRRISIEQPAGYQMLRDLHPPGFPISNDPSSRVQRETNLWGQSLGFAAAQAENVRSNLLPDRAYGEILRRWERITHATPKAGDSLETRRARVIGRLRARAGASVPGVKEALKELVATDVDNLAVIGLPQELRRNYGRRDAWTFEPYASGGLVKNAGVAAWDAGASSAQTFAGDGFVESTVASIAYEYLFGLSDVDANVDYSSIDYGIHVDNPNGDLKVYENGVQKFFAAATVVVGDVLRAERRGTAILYKRNGVTFYTSLVASTGELRVDASLYDVSAAIAAPRFGRIDTGSVDVEIGIDWIKGANVAIAEPYWKPQPYSRVVKIGGSGAAYDAGASSVETIAGDGYLEFTVLDVSNARYVGFTAAGETFNLAPSSIDYAIRHDVTDYTPTENGAAPGGVFAGAAIGDVLRIERIGSTIYYKRNGSTYYTSAVPSTGELRVIVLLLNLPTTLSLLKLVDAGVEKAITWQNNTNVSTADNYARAQASSGDTLINEGQNGVSWKYLEESIPATQAIKLSGQVKVGLGAHLMTKISPVAIPSRGEVGIAFVNRVTNTSILFGLRNNAGAYQIITEAFVAGVSQGAVVRATSSLREHWLHLYHDTPRVLGDALSSSASTWNMRADYSTTGPTSGNTSIGFTHPAGFEWALCYMRSFDIAGTKTLAGALDVLFDDTRLWAPFGDRSLRFYVFRDPTLAGAADIDGANATLQGLKQAHTEATIITSKAFICDSPNSLTDRDPLGGF